MNEINFTGTGGRWPNVIGKFPRDRKARTWVLSTTNTGHVICQAGDQIAIVDLGAQSMRRCKTGGYYHHLPLAIAETGAHADAFIAAVIATASGLAVTVFA